MPKQRITNPGYAKSDCSDCRHMVDGVCTAIKRHPKPYDYCVRTYDRCGYWFPRKGDDI